MVLAQAARVRCFIAKVRRVQVIHLQRQRLCIQAGFDKRTHHASRALRLQGDGAVALVLEGIHLLAHHVAGLACGARKELGMLKYRRANLGVTGQPRHLAHQRLDGLQAGAFRRQHVLGTLGNPCQHSFHLKATDIVDYTRALQALSRSGAHSPTLLRPNRHPMVAIERRWFA